MSAVKPTVFEIHGTPEVEKVHRQKEPVVGYGVKETALWLPHLLPQAGDRLWPIESTEDLGSDGEKCAVSS